MEVNIFLICRQLLYLYYAFSPGMFHRYLKPSPPLQRSGQVLQLYNPSYWLLSDIWIMEEIHTYILPSCMILIQKWFIPLSLSQKNHKPNQQQFYSYALTLNSARGSISHILSNQNKCTSSFHLITCIWTGKLWIVKELRNCFLSNMRIANKLAL